MTTRFKLLSAGGDGDYLIGWVKSQCKRFIAGGNRQFDKMWIVDGIEVHAKSSIFNDDEVVRISVGLGSGKYYYTGLASTLCGRTLSIQSFDSGLPPAVPGVGSFVSIPPPIITSNPTLWFDPQVGSPCEFGCTANAVSESNGGGPGIPYTGDPPSQYARWSGSYLVVSVPPGATFITDVGGSWSDYGPAGQAAHDAAVAAYNAALNTSAYGKSYRVVLSDGQVLTQWHGTYVNGVETAAPSTFVWSGSGYVDLNDGTSKTFGVPDDVRAPALPDTPPGVSVVSTLIFTDAHSDPVTGATVGTNIIRNVVSGPGGSFYFDGSSVSDGIHTTLTDFYNFNNDGLVRNGTYLNTNFNGTFIGISISITLRSEYIQASDNDKWINARKEAANRERLLLKACSDLFLGFLSLGDFSALKRLARAGHLKSTKTYMTLDKNVTPQAFTLISGNVVDGQSGSGDHIVFTKTVTLQYTAIDVDGSPIVRSETINGTKNVDITHCTDSAGNLTQYTTTQYNQWLPITPATGSTATALDFTFLLDSGLGLAQIENGTQVSGAADAGATLSPRGENFVPPKAVTSDFRTYSYPAIYTQYRAEVKRAEVVRVDDVGNTSWLDSAIGDGEVVNVIPIYTGNSDYGDGSEDITNPQNFGDLGMFPSSRHTGDSSKLALLMDRVFSFKYKYSDGSWTFVKESRVTSKDSRGNVITRNDDGSTIKKILSTGATSTINCVFISQSAPWKTLRVAYSDQAKRLTSPAPSPVLTATELLINAVRTAITTL